MILLYLNTKTLLFNYITYSLWRISSMLLISLHKRCCLCSLSWIVFESQNLFFSVIFGEKHLIFILIAYLWLSWFLFFLLNKGCGEKLYWNLGFGLKWLSSRFLQILSNQSYFSFLYLKTLLAICFTLRGVFWLIGGLCSNGDIVWLKFLICILL